MGNVIEVGKRFSVERKQISKMLRSLDKIE